MCDTNCADCGDRCDNKPTVCSICGREVTDFQVCDCGDKMCMDCVNECETCYKPMCANCKSLGWEGHCYQCLERAVRLEQDIEEYIQSMMDANGDNPNVWDTLSRGIWAGAKYCLMIVKGEVKP